MSQRQRFFFSFYPLNERTFKVIQNEQLSRADVIPLDANKKKIKNVF